MNLEDMKKERDANIDIWRDETIEMVDWLIVEVERLEEINMKFVTIQVAAAKGERIKTATRCAEIAEKAKYLSDKPWTTDDVADAIRKEFKQ